MNIVEEAAASLFVCGADEVGKGSWAGPMVVCAAVTPRGWMLAGVTDSKKKTPMAREKLYPTLVKTVTHAVLEVSSKEIDAVGIGVVWKTAIAKVIQMALDAHKAQGHSETPLVIVDGNQGVLGALALPKADFLIPAVSAASIIAKVHHDRLMYALHGTYPQYSFDTAVGYGTKKHLEGLKKFGLCPEHRRSYSPMSEFCRTKLDRH